MALFGSWFDDLVGGGGGATPNAPIATTPTQAPVPAQAPPDAIAQLQALIQQRANPSPWQKVLGALGGGLKDMGMSVSGHPEQTSNISSYFGNLRAQQAQSLGQNALGQVMGDAATPGQNGQLPSDLPLKLAKLQALGVDITPIQTMLSLRSSMSPKTEYDKFGNGWKVMPDGTKLPLSTGPGDPTTLKDQIIPVNPYAAGAPATVAAPTGTGAPVSAPATGNAAAAMGFFQKAGWPAPAAAAITANLQAESRIDPNQPALAKGENGFGIAQWNTTRAQQFQQVMGKPLRGSTLQDQLGFVNWELTKGPYASIGNALKQSTDPRAATDLVLNKYEAPSDPNQTRAMRQRLAVGYLGQPAPTMLAQSDQTASDAPSGMMPSPVSAPQPQGVVPNRPLYSAPPDVTPIGQASAALQKAYPGASAIKADGTPIYPPSSAMEAQMFGSSAAAGGSNIHGQAYLQTVDPKIATQVKALAEGRMAFPTGFAISKPYWQQMLQAVSQYDPSFDAVNYNARAKTWNDFTSGKSAQNITAINTALQHAGVVSDKLTQMHNTSFPLLNQGKNWFAEEMGAAAPTNAREAVDALASEGRKVFAAAGGGNLTELENWQKNFPINGSPEQQQGAMKTFVALLRSRIEAVADQYNRGMGTTADPLSLLSPKARHTISALEGGGNSQQATGATQVRNAADYNRLPSGATYTDPNGVQRTKR